MSSDISKRQLGDPFFTKKNDYQTYPLDKKNFRKIPSYKNNRKIAFIDGGNQELLAAPEYSLQLNRVYFNIFKNNKFFPLQSNIPQRIEFLTFTSSSIDGEDIGFETKIATDDKDLKKYLPKERCLKTSAHKENVDAGTQAGMERMASMARRFAEWEITKKIMDNELGSNDIIVKDGSLQTGQTNESRCADSVFKKAKEKNVVFTGLSKTCRLTTDTGISLIASIKRLAEKSNLKYDKWCYYPVAVSKEENSEHKAVIMVVNLNKHAHSSFRFEIFKEQVKNMGEEEILDVVSTIANNSKDIRLPGYPYGLYDADLWARVKNEELESYKLQLYSELSKYKIFKEVTYRANCVNTHGKLDGQ